MNNIIEEDILNLINNDDLDVETFRNKTILITGVTGLIAKYFTYYFLYLNKVKNLNVKVIGLVRESDTSKDCLNDFKELPNFKLLVQDVCEPINCDDHIDYIFHAASSASAYAIKNYPVDVISANTLGTMNILNLAKEKQVTKVIFPSTREIYGELKDITSIKENDMGIVDPMVPRNSYPESKRLAEALFVAYSKQYNVPFNILRIAHTYGPTMELRNDGRVLSDFINNIVNDENIVLKSDGKNIRSFCYITDTIKGLLYVIIKGSVNEVYNLSNENEPYAVKDVASLLVNLYPEKNLNVVFDYQDINTNKSEYVNYQIIKMDTSKLEGLGWVPDVTLKDGLKRTVDSFKRTR